KRQTGRTDKPVNDCTDKRSADRTHRPVHGRTNKATSAAGSTQNERAWWVLVVAPAWARSGARGHRPRTRWARSWGQSEWTLERGRARARHRAASRKASAQTAWRR